MRRRPCPAIEPRAGRRPLRLLCLLSAVAVVGCHKEEKVEVKSVSTPPTVRVTPPEKRRIVRVVGQPSFVESYEHTSIFPKLVGYIEHWRVDIGDKVKKDELLAKLFVPELVEDYGTKKATVKLDEERVDLAQKVVEVADADVKAAAARVTEAKAILAKYQSEVDRWDTEVRRLTNEVSRGVVDPQILLESTNQWRSAVASRDAAKATIIKAEAELLSRQAALAKAKVDVSVAKADLAVAVSEKDRIKAWVGYITLTAPFDGIVVERTANTGDFVMPATGDPSAMPRTPHLAPGGSAAPIYVVDRLDVVRIFIDIPEADANFVRGSDLRLIASPEDIGKLPNSGRDMVVVARAKGGLHFRIFDSDGKQVVNTDEHRLAEKAPQIEKLKAMLRDLWDQPRISPIDKDKVLAHMTTIFGRDKIPVGSEASVLVQAYRDEPIKGTVTRTSWALNPKSRTLRAEVDLPNPETELLPGMYAYVKVIIDRPNVRALPVTALTHSGERTYAWTYVDGKSVRREVRTGISDGDWIEVTSLLKPNAAKGEDPWEPIKGKEQFILGDLSVLADGGPVNLATSMAETKVASAATDGPRPSSARP